MTKTFFLPLLACVCATSTIVHADVDFYGRLFLIGHYSDAKFDGDRLNTDPSTYYNDDYDEKGFQIDSHKSVIGIEGSEALSDSTDVTYTLESLVTIDGDGGNGSGFTSRTNYLGLKNDSLGEVRLGKHFSPVDLMNNVAVTQGYWDNLGNTTLSEDSAVNALNMADAPPRVANSMIWLSPKFDNLSLDLAFMYKSNDEFFEDNDINGEGFGGHAIYEFDNGVTLGAGYDIDIDIDGGLLRGTVSYDISKSDMTDIPLTLGVLYQQADYDDSPTKEDGFIISAEMDIDSLSNPAAVYAQYNNSSDLDGVDNADSQQLVVGGIYNLTERFEIHVYGGYNWADGVSRGSFTTHNRNNESTEMSNIGDAHVFAIGGGVQYYL